MFQRKNDLSKDVYTSFYRPKPGADGVWELPLVLETVAEASESERNDHSAAVAVPKAQRRGTGVP